MAGRYDIKILQGATFSIQLSWQDDKGQTIDLNGYAVYMQIRSSLKEEVLVLELNTTNEGITIEQNKIKIHIPATVTKDLRNIPCKYDLKLIKNDTAYRLIEGNVTISPEVTKL